MASQWLRGSAAKYTNETKTWTFPSGAKLAFGHMEHDQDRYRYQGAVFQFIGIDELSQFSEIQYRYMFSRLRRLKGSIVPIRMRVASNPGGSGHEWVKGRFIDDERKFIPARLDDNPHLDIEEYRESLAQLDPVTRAQLEAGDWEVRSAGGVFSRDWFEIVDKAPKGRTCRWWDTASTVPKKGKDPDYTVGCKVTLHDGTYYIEDVDRFREDPFTVKSRIGLTTQLDGKAVAIRMGKEPGSSGLAVADDYSRTILLGYDFMALAETGDKKTRAAPVSSAARGGRVKLVRGPWNREFLDELEAFPEGHDDQVDALSGAVYYLSSSTNWGMG